MGGDGMSDRLFRAGLVLVAVAAAASSFGALRGLAIKAGGWGQLAPLLPISLDTFAALSTRLWLTHDPITREARHWGRASALIAIGLSVAGNAVDHALSAGQLGISWPLTVAVGAVPPALLGLVIHLAHVASPAPVAPAQAATEPAPATVTVTIPAAPPVVTPAVVEQATSPTPEVASPGPLAWPELAQQPARPADDELLDQARRLVARLQADGQRVGAATLQRELSIGSGRARRLWQAIQAAPHLHVVEGTA
jgi:Protein of unknown function (DUF2637)